MEDKDLARDALRIYRTRQHKYMDEEDFLSRGSTIAESIESTEELIWHGVLPRIQYESSKRAYQPFDQALEHGTAIGCWASQSVAQNRKSCSQNTSIAERRSRKNQMRLSSSSSAPKMMPRRSHTKTKTRSRKKRYQELDFPTKKGVMVLRHCIEQHGLSMDAQLYFHREDKKPEIIVITAVPVSGSARMQAIMQRANLRFPSLHKRFEALQVQLGSRHWNGVPKLERVTLIDSLSARKDQQFLDAEVSEQFVGCRRWQQQCLQLLQQDVNTHICSFFKKVIHARDTMVIKKLHDVDRAMEILDEPTPNARSTKNGALSSLLMPIDMLPGPPIIQ